MRSGVATYQNSRVVGTRREGLVVLLYERLLADLRGAVVAIQAKDFEMKSQRLQHGLDIIFELLGTLDLEAGGDLAGRLASLYGFFITEINEVGRTLDVVRLERSIALIEGLYGSWRHLEAHAGDDNATAPAEAGG